MEKQEHIRHYSSEDVARLKELVKEGCIVHREIDDLKGGLSDTVKSIAEEMGVRPAVLNKVIRTAYKNNMHEERTQFEEFEDLVQTLGIE